DWREWYRLWKTIQVRFEIWPSDHPAVRIGMSIPGTDEHVIESSTVVRLAHDTFHLEPSIRIVDCPRVTRSLTRHRPRIMVFDAPVVNGLEAADVTNARSPRRSVEVARNDSRK